MNNLVELLPGEHLAGFVGRLHSLGLYESMSATTDDLQLSCNTIRPHRYFHSDDLILHHLFKNYGAESAWFDNGFGNYIRHFLRLNELSLITQHLNCAITDPLNLKLQGLHATHDNQWRWCYACTEEDYQQYGTSYYHRDHQLPGVFHCPKHNIGLSSNCTECGFTATELKQLTTPPVDNTCPNCGHWISSFEGYFSQSMLNIEMMSMFLANTDRKIHLHQLTEIILNHIGIDGSALNTVKGKKAITAWTERIASDFDPKALFHYFCNWSNKEVKSMSQLFKNPRLYNSSSPKGPLNPLLHIVALNYANCEVSDLSGLVEAESHE